MSARTQPLAEGDRIVAKFRDGEVMGYFMNYYNDYAVCALDDERDTLTVERRRVSRAPVESTLPVANIQILEATAPPCRICGGSWDSTLHCLAAQTFKQGHRYQPLPTTKEA